MAPSLNGPGRLDSTPAPAVSLDGDLAEISKRFEQINRLDEEKSKFMAELIAQYGYVRKQNQAMLSQRSRELEWVLQWQSDKQHYEKCMRNMQRAITDNSFVVVLIDGDGMIFRDEFLREGEVGGRRAASKLHAAIQNYVQDHNEHNSHDISNGSRIVCRIYANVGGLADVLVRTGVIPDSKHFMNFVRGFTRGKTLFDFVDVGAGKDRADEKIIESFKLYSQDYHCRRLLFGCSHDNGYARLLEECSDRDELLDKVVLLEGVPFEKELVSLPYKTKRFPDIFRDSKLIAWLANKTFNALSPSFVPTGISGFDIKESANFVVSTGLPSRFPAPASPRPLSTSSLLDSPLASSAALNHIARTPSTSSLASDGLITRKPTVEPMNYAAKAAAPPPSASPSPVYKASHRDEVIARNRAGQRVDPPCKSYDKTEVDRIKKLKLCNVHFLRKECPYGEHCTHSHAYSPTESEIATLRLVARMAPCVYGSGCQDIKCIYGHRCAAPRHKTNHVKGTKSCIFGDSCKFSEELHDIDTHVVKTLVIR